LKPSNVWRAPLNPAQSVRSFIAIRAASAPAMAGYLADHATALKVSTLTRRLAAISTAHEARDRRTPVHSPRVRATMRGIRRAHRGVREGIILTIPRSKTDQDGVGRKIGIPFGRTIHCPVRALEAWIAAAQIEDGRIPAD